MQIISIKNTVFHVDKLILYYLLHPVVHKHDSNIICCPLLQPSRLVPSLYPNTSSIPPYLILDSSSLFWLKCTLFTSLIRLQWANQLKQPTVVRRVQTT